jgi:tetratricopeptide (TPR) repeat protein
MGWFELLLDKAADAPLELRARALLAYARTTHPTGDDMLPERLYQESLEAFRQVGDDRGVAILLFRLANNAYYRGENERARQLAGESLVLHRSLGNVAGESQAVALFGELEYASGNVQEGAELIERSANLAGEAGFLWWRARMLRKLVDCMLELGRTSDADACARESLKIMSEIGDRQMVVFTLAPPGSHRRGDGSARACRARVGFDRSRGGALADGRMGKGTRSTGGPCPRPRWPRFPERPRAREATFVRRRSRCGPPSRHESGRAPREP